MLSTIRKVALAARHSAWLSSLEPLWRQSRVGYVRLLTALAGGRGIEVTIAGYAVKLHPSFTTQAWERIEPESYAAFAKEIVPGATVLDIGAHIGTYSMVALKIIGATGRLVAYEPNATTRSHLLQHIEWGDPHGVATVREVCCGKSSGTEDFYYLPGEVEGMNGLVPVDGFAKCSMPVVKLDDEVIALGVKPDVIKIDVEGAEWDVLKGAERVLRELRPTIFLSLHPAALAKRGESPADVLEWLHRIGYCDEFVAEDHEIHMLVRFPQ